MANRVILIISALNTTAKEDFTPFLNRRGYSLEVFKTTAEGQAEEKDSKEIIRNDLLKLNTQGASAALYARSFGALDKEGIEQIKSLVKVPVVVSTESIVKHLKLCGGPIYVITPYSQARHEMEIKWLEENGLEVSGSLCMERIEGAVISKVTPEDMIRAVKIANISLHSKGIYIACTFLPTLGIFDQLQKETKLPITSANSAIADDFVSLIAVHKND
ncbi:MAG: aspartate/glutamate racemase family protein [Conexivisphaerales archaeon]